MKDNYKDEDIAIPPLKKEFNPPCETKVYLKEKERFKQLQELYDELKTLIRNSGKSNMISKEKLEGLVKEVDRK